MFRFHRENFNKCPFVETRLYCLDSLDLKLVIDKVVSIIDDSLCFEHAFLSASYQVHQIRTKLITHASFYPVFSGSSGHGVDYGSFVSRAKSLLHGISYRLGV